jgi:hypothetical protein
LADLIEGEIVNTHKGGIPEYMIARKIAKSPATIGFSIEFILIPMKSKVSLNVITLVEFLAVFGRGNLL